MHNRPPTLTAAAARLTPTTPPHHLQDAVVTNCADHNMPGCETCTGDATACPDTLASLSQVCLAHRMEDCSQFYSMCDAAGSDLAHFCDVETASYDPPMRMYFHGGACRQPAHTHMPHVRLRRTALQLHAGDWSRCASEAAWTPSAPHIITA